MDVLSLGKHNPHKVHESAVRSRFSTNKLVLIPTSNLIIIEDLVSETENRIPIPIQPLANNSGTNESICITGIRDFDVLFYCARYLVLDLHINIINLDGISAEFTGFPNDSLSAFRFEILAF